MVVWAWAEPKQSPPLPVSFLLPPFFSNIGKVRWRWQICMSRLRDKKRTTEPQAGSCFFLFKKTREKSQSYAALWESGSCQAYHFVKAGFKFPKPLVKSPDGNGKIWNIWEQYSISFSVLFLLSIASAFLILTIATFSTLQTKYFHTESRFNNSS